MFNSLDSLLKRSLKRHHLTQPVATAQLLTQVNEVLGEIFGSGIERKAKAISVQGDRITIACASSVLASEIRLQEQRILTEVSARCSRNRLSTESRYTFGYRWQ